MSGLIHDLGFGHTLQFFRWAPGDLPGNRERYGYPLPMVERAGAIVVHPHKKLGGKHRCASGIHFENVGLPAETFGARWRVESWDPLTLSPSLLCLECGDHGFVRAGRWVPA